MSDGEFQPAKVTISSVFAFFGGLTLIDIITDGIYSQEENIQLRDELDILRRIVASKPQDASLESLIPERENLIEELTLRLEKIPPGKRSYSEYGEFHELTVELGYQKRMVEIIKRHITK